MTIRIEYVQANGTIVSRGFVYEEIHFDYEVEMAVNHMAYFRMNETNFSRLGIEEVNKHEYLIYHIENTTKKPYVKIKNCGDGNIVMRKDFIEAAVKALNDVTDQKKRDNAVD